MTYDDAWRRRLADERYGDSLTPGFARSAPVAAEQVPAVAPQGVYRAPPPQSPTAYASRWSGSRATGWAVAALLAVALAAAIGWIARGNGVLRYIDVPVPASSSRDTPATPTSGPVFPITPFAAPASVDRSVIALPPPSASPAAQPATALPAPVATKMPVGKHRKPGINSTSAPAAAAPAAVAPGLSCVAGTGPASRRLCDSPRLRRFDEQMQAAQAQVVAHADQLLIGQMATGRERFFRRRERCGDEACLIRLYTDRIVELVKLLPAGAATPPICLPEQYTRTPIMNCWPSHLRPIRKPFFSQ